MRALSCLEDGLKGRKPGRAGACFWPRQYPTWAPSVPGGWPTCASPSTAGRASPAHWSMLRGLFFFPQFAYWWSVLLFVGHLKFSRHYLHSAAISAHRTCGSGLTRLGGLGRSEVACGKWAASPAFIHLRRMSSLQTLHCAWHTVVFLWTLNEGVKTERGPENRITVLVSMILLEGGEKVTASVWESFQGCSPSCLCSVERVVWVSWIQLRVSERIIHLFRGRRKESLLFEGRAVRPWWFQSCNVVALWQYFPEKYHTKLHLKVSTEIGNHWEELRAASCLTSANHLVWPRLSDRGPWWHLSCGFHLILEWWPLSTEGAGIAQSRARRPWEWGVMGAPIPRGTFQAGDPWGSPHPVLVCVLNWVLLQLLPAFPQPALLCCFPWIWMDSFYFFL